MIHHFYHLFADGAWLHPLLGHLRALESVPGDLRVTVGLVGDEANRAKARTWLDPAWQVHEADTGFEQVTLDLLHADVQVGRITGPVLYAHSKGAFHQSRENTLWRHCMTRNLITRADRALDFLAAGADTVGCHWLTPEEYPDSVQVPYYGGNFWWASSEHLARLDSPSYETRYHAEAWLGTVVPQNPVDVAPGWPGAGCRNH